MNDTGGLDHVFDSVKGHLHHLRRFARALTGSQESGDAYTAATLEAIIADRSAFLPDLPPKVSLFRSFHAVWASSGSTAASGGDVPESMQAIAQQRMAELSPPSREAFLLRSLEDFSFTETGTVMGVTAAEAELLHNSALHEIERQTASRILIIEDEPIIAMDIESIVLELGHTSLGIADTKDIAVRMAQEHRPDLILSDIQLADGSSGIDAAADILARHSVPIIFITAFPERLLTGERPEPTFLITKPFKRPAVQAAISQALFFGNAGAIEI